MNRMSFVLLAGLFGPISSGDCADAKTNADYQDFVFLGEARPVLVRIHARVEGKSLTEASEAFFTQLFNYLDVDGNGTLSKQEAERAPTLESIFGGGVGRRFEVGGMRKNKAPESTAPKMEDLDTNKDGKVSREELVAYYRMKGFKAYQFQLAPPASQFNIASFLGGSRSEPSVAAVRTAIFALLDTDNDGKLTKEKLAAAPAILLRLDEDDDEVITTKELIPDPPAADPFATYYGMMGGAPKKEAAPNSTLLIPTPSTKAEMDHFVSRLLDRYGPKSDKPAEKKLSRKELGIDEAAFKQLDANKDGVLDAKELAEFFKRDPDLDLKLTLGQKAEGEASIAVMKVKDRPSPPAKQITFKDGLLFLDLRLTQLEMRIDDVDRADQFASLVRQQILTQFKQADPENKGWVDAQAAKDSRVFASIFKAIDRKGSGKITEKDVNDYLDEYAKLQGLAKAACITLALTDVSRGLFDLLDTDRDGRLSVREMRQAPLVLEKFDRAKKGYLTQDDIPQSFRLTVRRGPIGGQEAAMFASYFGGYADVPAERAAAGPAWFRKMDRNGDGDVSRKEFLGSDEQFRKIDANGDGLISLEEAMRYDASQRKR